MNQSATGHRNFNWGHQIFERYQINTVITCNYKQLWEYKNILVGVVYRAHTPFDNFIADIDPVFENLNAERKHVYIVGDFNNDLLKVDENRPTHDYLELIYSYSFYLLSISQQE